MRSRARNNPIVVEEDALDHDVRRPPRRRAHIDLVVAAMRRHTVGQTGSIRAADDLDALRASNVEIGGAEIAKCDVVGALEHLDGAAGNREAAYLEV